MVKKNLNEVKTSMAERWEEGYLRHRKRYLKELKKLGYTPKSLKKIKDRMESARINCLAQHQAKVQGDLERRRQRGS